MSEALRHDAERELWFAVVRQILMDLSGNNSREREAANAWLFGDEHACDREVVCELAGLREDALLVLAHRILHDARSRRRRRGRRRPVRVAGVGTFGNVAAAARAIGMCPVKLLAVLMPSHGWVEVAEHRVRLLE